MAFVPLRFITIGANMRNSLVQTFYAVFLTQSITVVILAQTETNRTKEHFDKELGPLLIHVKTTKLPPEAHAVRWDDRHVTLKTSTLVNFVKALPELNPFNGDIFGPYDASIPDLHFNRGNLTFGNVSVTGIEEFSTQNVNMQLSPTRIDLNASIPNITVEADFDLDTIFDNNLLIRDRGHFRVSLLDTAFSAVIGPQSVQMHTGRAYQLETAVIDIDIKDVQLHMDTQYAEEAKIILDEFFKKSEDIIVDNDVLNMILKAVNQELAKIPAKKIVNYMLGTAEPNLTLFAPDGTRKSGRKYSK